MSKDKETIGILIIEYKNRIPASLENALTILNKERFAAVIWYPKVQRTKAHRLIRLIESFMEE